MYMALVALHEFKNNKGCTLTELKFDKLWGPQNGWEPTKFLNQGHKNPFETVDLSFQSYYMYIVGKQNVNKKKKQKQNKTKQKLESPNRYQGT